MPSSVLSKEPVRVEPLNILGKGDPVSGFLTHAMLCDESDVVDVVLGQPLRVIEMVPPLVDRLNYLTVAGDAQLSDDQKRQVKAFADTELMDSKAARKLKDTIGIRQYTIHKSYRPPSKKLSTWRYSCVGFVLRAYLVGATIKLLKQPSPLKSISEIQLLYPDQDLSKKFRQKWLGVGEGTGTDRDGVECWPVDLVGYLMHSLDRPAEEINGENATPYQPQEGDEFFPRQSS